MHPAHARAMLAAAAGCLAVISYGFSESAAGRTGDDLWPWWFAASAVSCAVFAVCLWSRVALQVSGLLVPLGFMAKALGLVIDLDAGLAPDPGRSVAGVAVWILFAVMCATTWVYVLGPVVSWVAQRHRRP